VPFQNLASTLGLFKPLTEAAVGPMTSFSPRDNLVQLVDFDEKDFVKNHNGERAAALVPCDATAGESAAATVESCTFR